MNGSKGTSDSGAGATESGAAAGAMRLELRNGWIVRSQDHWQYMCEGKLQRM